MEYALPVIVLFGIPLAMLFIFKTNVGVMYLAACAGLVLMGSLDQAVVSTAGAIVPTEGEAYVRLGVVLATMCFAGLIFRHSVAGSSLALHAVVAVLLGAMLWLTLPAVTGVSWLVDSTKVQLWDNANDFNTLVIAAGIVLSLFVILASRRKAAGHHKKSKHHK